MGDQIEMLAAALERVSDGLHKHHVFVADIERAMRSESWSQAREALHRLNVALCGSSL
jgi:hypothetical protein